MWNAAAAPRSLKRGCVVETLSDLERNESLSGELVLKRRIYPAIPREPLFDQTSLRRVRLAHLDRSGRRADLRDALLRHGQTRKPRGAQRSADIAALVTAHCNARSGCTDLRPEAATRAAADERRIVQRGPRAL